MRIILILRQVLTVWMFFRVAAVVLHGTIGEAIFRKKNQLKTTTTTKTVKTP